MKAAVLLIALFCVACAEVEQAPEQAPAPLVAAGPGYYTVALQPSVSDAMADVVIDAAERMNERLGFEAFRVVSAELTAPRDWWISVSDGPEFVPEGTTLGWSAWGGTSCTVRLHFAANWKVVAHEMAGHCVGLEHVADQDNLMYSNPAGYAGLLTEEQLDTMRTRIMPPRS